MSMVKKSISVTAKQNQWIRKKIDSGQYGNESELLRQLIREKQATELESDNQIHAIRAKLLEAEKSGFSDKSAGQLLREIKSELKPNG